ncbi:MAG TPA: glycosyltransferase family 4 protein [Capsulimonadaceae bacterium]|jgi:glycosyltransferase involved in cell wall biosynthesis
MKTVLYVDHTAKLGGGEIAIFDLICALDKSTVKPIVVLASSGPLVDKFRQSDIETHVLPLSPSVVDVRKDSLGVKSAGRLRAVGHIAKYALTLARWAKSNHVDLIHTNSLKSDIYGGLAGRLAGIPVIWHIRDSISSSYLPSIVAKLFRWLTAVVPNAVVTNSESTLKCLELPRTKRAAVVYSGITPPPSGTEAEPSNVDSLASASNPAVVTLVGRIAEWKGQHIFIEAAAKVLVTYPDTQFQIVGAPLFGEFDYEKQIHQQVDTLGIGNSVNFLGFRNDIPQLLAESTIVVHASTIGEPFGQVVVQGMAAGKPVIATNGGALPEIVLPGQTGMLVSMGSSTEMAEAMLWILGNPDAANKMGAAGQKRAYEHFSIKQSAQTISSLYDEMLNRPAKEISNGSTTTQLTGP